MPEVRLVINFTSESAEDADQRIEDLKDRCLKAQQEPGCLQFEVFRSAMSPERYVLIERWESEEALEVHRLAGLQQGAPAPRPSTTKRVRETYFYHEGETPA